MIGLDELLYGTPTWPQVREFWRDADFDSEEYLVAAIEKHLLTEEQRKIIFDLKLSIEKMLNGRYGDVGTAVDDIYKAWNHKLGLPAFGDFPQAEIELHSQEEADALYVVQRAARPELYEEAKPENEPSVKLHVCKPGQSFDEALEDVRLEKLAKVCAINVNAKLFDADRDKVFPLTAAILECLQEAAQPDPESAPVADDCGRPNFSEFAQALRKEVQWIQQLHGDGKKLHDAGQSVSDAASLVRLAEKVEQIGRGQGYIQ